MLLVISTDSTKYYKLILCKLNQFYLSCDKMYDENPDPRNIYFYYQYLRI